MADEADVNKALELEMQSIERMDSIPNDEEFLNYCLEHSKTPRHIYHRVHAQRLYDLAGLDQRIPEKKEFITHLDYEALWPLVEKAKERLGLNKKEKAN